MTSFTKPEVHNALRCRQRRTEPRPQLLTCTEDFVSEVWTRGFRDMRADRQNRHADTVWERQTFWSQYCASLSVVIVLTTYSTCSAAQM